MTDEPQPLAIDGGAPVRSAPWPPPSEPEPASDAEPVGALEAALAGVLDLPPTAVVACADADEAYRALLDVLADAARPEVVVPSLLHRRAAEAVQASGRRVVPGDVDADTAALSVRGLARAIGEQTGTAVVGHAFGHPPMMNEVARIAAERDVTVIEDITGALGASFRGQPAGRMGRAAILVGRTGDPLTRGTLLVAPEEDDAARLREATATLGADDARIALAEVRALEETLTHRRHLAWELTFRLRGMRGVTPMPHGRWVHHAYARYVVRLRSLVWKRSLEDTLAALRVEGIPAEAACDDPLHADEAIRAALLETSADDPRIGDDVFPIANRLPGELIAIPLDVNLTSKDMDQVADALRKIEAHSL